MKQLAKTGSIPLWHGIPRYVSVDLAITFVILDTLNIFLIDWLIDFSGQKVNILPQLKYTEHTIQPEQNVKTVFNTAWYNSLLLRLEDIKLWSSRGNAFLTSHFRPFTVCIRTPSHKKRKDIQAIDTSYIHLINLLCCNAVYSHSEVSYAQYRVTTLQTMSNSWRFAALLRDTRHVKCYSYHACTSVIVSGGGTNATVYDPKPYIWYLTQHRLLLNTCMDTNMQLTINSFRQLFPNNIFPLTFSKIPDISVTAVKIRHLQVFQTSGHPVSKCCCPLLHDKTCSSATLLLNTVIRKSYHAQHSLFAVVTRSLNAVKSMKIQQHTYITNERSLISGMHKL